MTDKCPQKKAYNFYRSYYDVLNFLDDERYVKLSKAINAVMFFDAHIDDVEFNDPMLDLSWASLKHSLRQSIDGYLSKNKIEYNQILKTPAEAPWQGGCTPPAEAPSQAPCQQGEEEGQEKGKEKGKEKGQGKGELTHSGKGGKKPPLTGQTWEAYSQAYLMRYGVEPTRNATVNGQLANFVKRVGKEDAPHVAAFYLHSNDQWHIKQRHSIADLCKASESLHTAWKIGGHMTSTQARQIDKSKSNLNAFEQLMREAD
jgi:hypothetical protein